MLFSRVAFVHETGLYEKWAIEWRKNYDQFCVDGNTLSIEQFQLSDFIGLFVLFTIGMTVSVVIFLIEKSIEYALFNS